MASMNGFRVFLYTLLFLFSIVLLGLSATRLHYTIFLPKGDPLNNGHPFYDPIVVELAITSIFAMFWSAYSIHIIHRGYDYGWSSTFAFELFGLFVLFVMFLVGAAIASTFWGNLFWCHTYWQCRVLTVLVAFAWMCWTLAFALLFISAVVAVASRAFRRPMHAAYDPRDSYFQGPRRKRWFW